MYYPHVASEPWWTGIVAYNPSTSPCEITVTPYTADGTSLATQTRTIEAKGKYFGTIADLNLPENTSWFQIAASTSITGFELFGTNNGNQLGGYTAVNINRNEGVFPKIEKDGWTGIAFVNIENSAAIVTLTAYDDSGSSVAIQSLTVGPHAKEVKVAESFFTQDISSATYISFSSDKEIVGFQLNGSADGMLLDALPGM